MSADEEIAPELAKGCGFVLLAIVIVAGLIFFAIRGIMR